MFTSSTLIRQAFVRPVGPVILNIRSIHDKTLVFLSGVPPVIKREELKTFFRKRTLGLKDARLYRDTMTNKNNGTGLLTFYNESSAEAAIERLNLVQIAPGYKIEMSLNPSIFDQNDKLPKIDTTENLRIQDIHSSFHNKEPKMKGANWMGDNKEVEDVNYYTTLYVSRLSPVNTILRLKRIFEQFGVLRDLQITKKDDELQARVEFLNHKSAKAARETLSQRIKESDSRLFGGCLPKIIFTKHEQTNFDKNGLPKKNYLNIVTSPIFRNDFRLMTREEEAEEKEQNKRPRKYSPDLHSFSNISIPDVKQTKVLPGYSDSDLARPRDSLRPPMTKVLPPRSYETFKSEVNRLAQQRRSMNWQHRR